MPVVAVNVKIISVDICCYTEISEKKCRSHCLRKHKALSERKYSHTYQPKHESVHIILTVRMVVLCNGMCMKVNLLKTRYVVLIYKISHNSKVEPVKWERH